MTEDIGLNRLDNYRECCPWLMLTRSVRYALGLQVLMLAALGALGNAAGWRIAATLTLDDPVPLAAAPATADESVVDDPLGQDVAYLSAWPGSRDAPICPFMAAAVDQQAAASIMRDVPPPAEPVLSVPYRVVRPFAQLLNRNLAPRHYAYYILGSAWTLLIWSFLGAAITRIAILQFGRDEHISIGQALAHARSKLGAHLAACTVPVAIALFGALGLLLFGLVGRLSFGATLIGVFWFVPLLGSIAMAVILVGVLFGWPLIWGAIDTERSDSFDGMSRAYAYTGQRPLKYVALVVFAAGLGYAGWLLVWFVSEFVIQLGIVTVAAGTGGQRMAEMLGEVATDSSLVAAGGVLVRFWNGVIRTLASAYGYGYFWCAMAGIYLLLRLDVDAAELDDISTDDAPERFGLPSSLNESQNPEPSDSA